MISLGTLSEELKGQNPIPSPLSVEAIAPGGDRFVVVIQMASFLISVVLMVGLGHGMSPIPGGAGVAMDRSADGCHFDVPIRGPTRALMDASCSCDFMWWNFTGNSAFSETKGMHAMIEKTILATSDKAVYFSAVDEVSNQFAVTQFATGNENDSGAVMSEQKHFVLGRLKSISSVACEGANFQTSVQQPLDAFGVVYQWSLSVSDFIEQFVDIEVSLTVTLVVLATGWLLTRKYPCRWMFLALMVLLNSMGQKMDSTGVWGHGDA